MTSTITRDHTIGTEPVTAEIRRWWNGSAHRGLPLGPHVTVRRREGNIRQVFNSVFSPVELERQARLYLAEIVAPVDPDDCRTEEQVNADADARWAFIAALREMAAFLAEHHEVPVPSWPDISVCLNDDEVGRLRHAAAANGVEVRTDVHTDGNTHHVANLQFGPIRYHMFAIVEPDGGAA